MFLGYVLLVIYAYIISNRLTNDILVLVTVMIIIDGIYFFIVSKKVRIELTSVEMVQRDEAFELRVKLINEALLPSPYMELIPQQKMRMSLDEDKIRGLMLVGKEQMTCTILYRARLCGLEEIGIEKIVLRSFFSFFKREVTPSIKVQVKILPRIIKISHLELFNEFLEQIVEHERKTWGEDLLDIAGDEVGYELRPYVQGDSQRLIHWKIAAYRDEFLVRQRQQENEKKNSIFLMLSPFLASRDNEEAAVAQDKILTTFISLVGYYLKQEQKVQVAYYQNQDWQYMKIKEYGQLQQLQMRLGDYNYMDVEQTVHQRRIIKSLIKIAKRYSGIKILVSGYWTQEMQEYMLMKSTNKRIPCIWAGEEIPSRLMEKTSLPMWYVTNQYEIVLLDPTEVERNSSISKKREVAEESISAWNRMTGGKAYEEM